MSKTENANATGIDRKDVYTKVTERIICDLEQGIPLRHETWGY